MGINPVDLRGMTFRELQLCIQSYNDSIKERLLPFAWQTAHLINISMREARKPVTVAMLLDAEPEPHAKVQEAWQQQEKLDSLAERFGLKKYGS